MVRTRPNKKSRKETMWKEIFLMISIIFLTSYGILSGGELDFDTSSLDSKINMSSIVTMPAVSVSWCDTVRAARESLKLSHLRVSYPCERMKPAVSAIVCMLTDGVSEKKANRIVFTARDYINGAASLGASLQNNIDHSQTHQLLLLREGFELEQDDLIRLQSVGWTIGQAPDFPLAPKFIPKFPRYKTTYTKVTAIGMSEYKCVLLMDADTLAVGDLRDLMKCDTVFQHPNNQVGGTIDWYQGRWKFFNTGSILWKTDSVEMERVFNLTEDPSFMKRFGSDQDFLNNVYPDRLHNTTLNKEVVALDNVEARGYPIAPVIPHERARTGAVVPLSWDYNAQTHAEVRNSEFWNSHRPTVRILHFTQKKGWQCDRSTSDPPPLEEMPAKCKPEIPICFCREAHLYWRALELAERASKAALEEARGP